MGDFDAPQRQPLLRLLLEDAQNEVLQPCADLAVSGEVQPNDASHTPGTHRGSAMREVDKDQRKHRPLLR